MYMKRKVDQFLAEWKKNPSHLPLIIRGPRQVGKTESILHFAKSNYKNTVYINFVEEPKYKNIAEEEKSEEAIIKKISRIDPSKVIVPHETVLIFDEIQEYPNIASTLKFFKLKNNYDVILSGSMLGLSYKSIESNSVGYKEDYSMSSLDFEEFLWAKGYGDDLTDDLLSHMVENKPLSPLDLQICQELFLDYCTLGGMPRVVDIYMEQKNFLGTLALQRQLLLDYEEDIKKYLNGLEQTKVLSIFRNIPSQLAKENKKFQISKISKNAKLSRYMDAIEWLHTVGVIKICYCLHLPESPFSANRENNKFKLYFADTGLLLATMDDDTQEDFRANRDMGIYKGALYENIVAEALYKSGAPLYYYQRENGTLEEDFFLKSRGSVIPLEVKATNGRAQSLRTLIKSDSYPMIQEGIKLVKGNIGFENQIHTFPYFCAFLLQRYLKTR